MWADHALPSLRARGLGTEITARTYRLSGIGESQVAERLGEAMLRTTNPIVATYARVEAVDVRISAVAEPPRSAEELVDEAATKVLERLGGHVWATGETTWSEAIGSRLGELGWTLSAVEIGTAGSFGQLLGDADWFRFDQAMSLDAPAAAVHAVADGDPHPQDDGARADGTDTDGLLPFARRARELGGSEVGVAVRARARTGDTAVSIAISTPRAERTDRRIVFLTGPLGRSRSALAAAAFLLEALTSG